jgi:hypothetical protein
VAGGGEYEVGREAEMCHAYGILQDEEVSSFNPLTTGVSSSAPAGQYHRDAPQSLDCDVEVLASAHDGNSVGSGLRFPVHVQLHQMHNKHARMHARSNAGPVERRKSKRAARVLSE